MLNKNKLKINLQKKGSLLRHCQHEPKKKKTDKLWLSESVGKLKGTGNQGEDKINEMSIHTNADL